MEASGLMSRWNARSSTGGSSDANGKGFRYAPHEMQRLRPRDPELTTFAAAVDNQLDVWRQFGRISDLVDEHGRSEALQEELGVGLRKFAP